MSKFVRDFISYYWSSGDKQKFIDLVGEAKMSAFSIYRLSKGKVAKSANEFRVLYLLKEKGIIAGIRYK
ncbi:MAG: hypothetical protein ACK5M3_17690 [Dysgonomonas sp.]|jgi:hypothetical protein|nr:hypothetical protein [Prevotella sp.]MDR3056963.1 hypothetical protein [Prevotella sp.]